MNKKNNFFLLPHSLLTVGLFVFVVGAMGNTDTILESKIHDWMRTSNKLRFLENKGQMGDLQGVYSPVENRAGKCVADMNLLFKVNSPGLDLYVTTRGLSYVFFKMEKQIVPQLGIANKRPGQRTHANEFANVQYCRADMELVGADINKENIIKEYESEDRTDYYLPSCPAGIKDVHYYQKITIGNIYPGIDWVLYMDDDLGISGGLKYDFIVHPGADASLIKLRYNGMDKPVLQKDGSMKIHAPMGDIVEGTPISYGRDKKQKINTNYLVRGSEVGFKLGQYNSEDTLVIDPPLIWATYYGGTSSDEITSINSDGTNVWVAGVAQAVGFPDTLGGAYFQKTGDFTILQFSTCGQLIWAAYYGGSGMDQVTSINSDGTNVWVTGETGSKDFPTLALAGAYNQAALGSDTAQNVFILQFSCANSARIWATYYGGSGYDGGSSICSDKKNVWITGYTSSTDFPKMFPAGSYQQPALGGAGAQNAFILQFNCVNSTRIWASYYGGSGGDAGSSISSDGTNAWVTGVTLSTDFPTLFPTGSYRQATLKGSEGNAFLLKIDAGTGGLLWATYYGGSGSGSFGDLAYSISSDKKNVWVTGYTYSTDFPTLFPAGSYKQAALGGSGGNAFISQFDCTSNTLVWSSYYGGSGLAGDEGYSITSDGMNVWVCGVTNSADFPTQKPVCGYFLGTLGSGGQDVFILQFSTSGALEWGTYYGNDTENDGSCISSDGTSVFVSGDASLGSAYPTITPGGNAYFDQSIEGTENIFMAKFSIVCSDSLLVSGDTTVCSGASVILRASGTNSYTWTPGTSLNSVSNSSVIAKPVFTTTYTVTGTSLANCLSQTAAVTIKVSPVTAGFSSEPPPGNIYPNTSVQFTDKSKDATNWLWNFADTLSGPNDSSALQNPSHLFAKPGKYCVLLAVKNAANCPEDTSSCFIVIPEVKDSIFIPNVFSPNGDGKNDEFYFTTTGMASLTYRIYDRWGLLIFEAGNINTKWDGRTKSGEMESDGTYYYTYHIQSDNGKTYNGSGFVQLIMNNK